MKIKNHCKVDIKGLEMKKEDFIRKHDDACCYYFDGYYSSCIEEFLGEIYDDFEAEIKAKEERIKELEEAMKPKTCDGCRYGAFGVDSFGLEIECTLAYRCSRGQDDMFKQKDNK